MQLAIVSHCIRSVLVEKNLKLSGNRIRIRLKSGMHRVATVSRRPLRRLVLATDYVSLCEVRGVGRCYVRAHAGMS